MDEAILNELELLSLYIETGQPMSRDQIYGMLMNLVEKLCTDEYTDAGFGRRCDMSSGIVSVTNAHLVERFISILRDNDMLDVIKDFEWWNYEEVLCDKDYISRLLNPEICFDADVIGNNLSVSKKCYLAHLKEYRT